MIKASSAKTAKKRLEILNKSNDGFFIASEDLKLRGPGDFFGIRQSGDLVFALADIYQGGKYYDNVIVTLKSNQPDFFFIDKYKVKVTVTDASGSKVWNKTFKNAFLYVFSSGQIQVGKPNFDQLVITKSSSTGDWIGKVREKEGVY